VATLRQQELLHLAERASDLALKKGANEAEAYVFQDLSKYVNIERGQISKTSWSIDRGLGCRTIINKSVGFCYTNVLENENTIEETVLKALLFAKANRPDDNWRGLPTEKHFASVENTYDRKIESLRAENLVETASVMLDAAGKKDVRVFPIEGEVRASCLSFALANSNRVSVEDRGTMIECSLATVGHDAGKVTPVCFEFNLERTYDIDPVAVGEEAARLAVSALKTKKTETKETSVILTQFALQQLLSRTFINAISAERVQRDQSVFRDKIGEKVASETVTVYDDGLLPGGIRTWKSDSEGVPQQKTLIIEKGVLRGFIYDNYAARKEGRESTGNGARASYLSTPSVDATNLHFQPGSKSPEAFISEIGEGLLVNSVQGAHTSNPASGEFSVVAAPCWNIKNGEITYPVKGAMLTGDIFHLLANVSGVANNERKIGQLVAPWVLIGNVKVIGK
jgi:PmbA protein